MIEVSKLHINYKAREWCKLPYPDHPHGCPNFGKRPTCPPDAPLIENFIDVSKPTYIVTEEFDLRQHIVMMRNKHPDWSLRQLRNLLYWQGGVNSRLLAKTRLIVGDTGLVYTTCPEAMGVNVISTCKDCGIPMETKPISKVFKVALIGSPIL